MLYLRDKGKKIEEMSEGIAEFVLVLEGQLRDRIGQELLDEENRDGGIREDHQELLLSIARDARRIAEDIRVQAFDRARQMVIDGIRGDEKAKPKRKEGIH
jgi:hypothetical protein